MSVDNVTLKLNLFMASTHRDLKMSVDNITLTAKVIHGINTQRAKDVDRFHDTKG